MLAYHPCQAKMRHAGNEFDSTLVPPSVTVNTERNQVIERIVAQLTSFDEMMHLQVFRRTAVLASPSVSLEHSVAQQPICIRAEL